MRLFLEWRLAHMKGKWDQTPRHHSSFCWQFSFLLSQVDLFSWLPLNALPWTLINSASLHFSLSGDIETSSLSHFLIYLSGILFQSIIIDFEGNIGQLRKFLFFLTFPLQRSVQEQYILIICALFPSKESWLDQTGLVIYGMLNNQFPRGQ